MRGRRCADIKWRADFSVARDLPLAGSKIAAPRLSPAALETPGLAPRAGTTVPWLYAYDRRIAQWNGHPFQKLPQVNKELRYVAEDGTEKSVPLSDINFRAHAN